MAAIAETVADALEPLTIVQVYEGVDYGKKGEDFTVAFSRFRLPGKVDDLAKKIIEKFQADDWVESVTHDRAFLHLKCRTATLNRLILHEIHALTYPGYGANSICEGKRVVIEYSSPNIAKSFHVGHLRSTIVGAWDVHSLNWLTGARRFGSSVRWDVSSTDIAAQFGLIAVGFEKYGSQEALEQNTIQHPLEIYVKVNADAEKDPTVREQAAAWFKRMEDGDEEALRNWRVWRELSIKTYAEGYARLNAHFDEYTGESMVGPQTMEAAVNKLQEMGLIEEDNGALRVNLEKYELGKAVIRKRDGTSIYLTRDVGAAIERYDKYKFNKMMYVVSTQQDLHLQQFFKVLSLMGYDWADRLEHVNYGLVLGMSTRRSTVVFLDDIIRDAATEKYKAVEDPEKVALEIGITGVKIQDMAAKRCVPTFPHFCSHVLTRRYRYAHVRLSSIERKNPELLPLPAPSQLNLDTLVEPQAREIVLLLGSYPDVVKTALKNHEPSGIVTFAFRLSHAISSAWETVIVKGEQDKEKAKARMAPYLAARDVLGAVLRLLNIKPLDRM
ncbi:arginyl-tRNA synthetase [Polyporus arcularius HHB13444]|uniref:arginine--tRNA ligase n=1 Tax=Polyporus arcularius HHB13444 TaxID=1314778 RepID=A0A5C3PAM5_9APHY|nr:arginyl-tRNA synthetase [Polyporus arcularius HHB13444]